MNICFITHYTNLHGANRSMLALIDGLRAKGSSVLVFCPHEGQITKELQERGIRYEVVTIKCWMTRRGRFRLLRSIFRMLQNFASLPSMLRTAKAFKANVVYTNSSATPVGFLLAKIARLPHVWHVREFGFQDFSLAHDFGRGFFEYFLDRSDCVIAISKAIRWNVLGRLKSKVHVIYNGVFSAANADAYRAARHMRIAERKQSGAGGPFTFAMIGRISSEKNQEEALLAFSLISKDRPEAQLVFAGNHSTPYGDMLKGLSVKLGLRDKVTFLGYVHDPFSILARSDALLMCSPHEAMGRVTAEAMAAGLPVIGLDNAGTSELIEDSFTGLLYRGTVVELAEKMAWLLAHQEDAERMGERAAKRALERYTIENYSGKIHELLTECIGRHGRPLR